MTPSPCNKYCVLKKQTHTLKQNAELYSNERQVHSINTLKHVQYDCITAGHIENNFPLHLRATTNTSPARYHQHTRKTSTNFKTYMYMSILEHICNQARYYFQM